MWDDISLSQGFLTAHMLRVAAPSPMNYSPAWDTGMWTLCPHRCCPLMSETSLPHLYHKITSWSLGCCKRKAGLVGRVLVTSCDSF